MALMLNLHAPTPERWLLQVRGGLDELLIDHAHCEKKAAGVALGMLVAYVERLDLCRAMTEIVKEELDHFHQVLDLLGRRGIHFRRIPPSRYGEKLHALIRKGEPQRAVDRMLVGALIEARSCERFGLLRDHLEDQELAEFFGSLFESEARHHSTYVRLAKTFAPAEQVQERLHVLAAEEARIIIAGESFCRMHS
jgi:tRNA 2-(methylsulfanyl)-N6-isopentenyladenosine37 hydroxylase